MVFKEAIKLRSNLNFPFNFWRSECGEVTYFWYNKYKHLGQLCLEFIGNWICYKDRVRAVVSDNEWNWTCCHFRAFIIVPSNLHGFTVNISLQKRVWMPNSRQGFIVKSAWRALWESLPNVPWFRLAFCSTTFQNTHFCAGWKWGEFAAKGILFGKGIVLEAFLFSCWIAGDNLSCMGKILRGDNLRRKCFIIVEWCYVLA